MRANPVNRIDRSGLQDEMEEVAAEADAEALDTISVPQGTQLTQGIGNELSALSQTESETVADAELETSAEGTAESTQGEWVEENLSNSRAAQYQAQITGRPGQAYLLNEVSFDGLGDAGELLEAKGPGYANLLQQSFGDSVLSQLQRRAARQVAAAAGKQIVWHFAEQAAADAFTQAIAGTAAAVIKIVVTAP